MVDKVYNLILSGWTKTDMSGNVKDKSHELRLHEINTLEWDDLVDANDHNASTMPNGGKLIKAKSATFLECIINLF